MFAVRDAEIEQLRLQSEWQSKQLVLDKKVAIASAELLVYQQYET
jgi:hypothetical protein